MEPEVGTGDSNALNGDGPAAGQSELPDSGHSADSGRLTDSAAPPTRPVDAGQLADTMLAELARSERAPAHRWTRVTANRRTAMLWALAGGAVAVVALITVLALLGLFV